MPSTEIAVRYAKALPRFRFRELRYPAKNGPFICQFGLAVASQTHVRIAAGIMHRGRQSHKKLFKKTVWIELSSIKSEQMCLRRDKLIFHIRHHAQMQRERRPAVIMARGLHVLWDGNHRVTAGLLLGKKRMRCDLYFDPAECKKTLAYIKRGGRK